MSVTVQLCNCSSGCSAAVVLVHTQTYAEQHQQVTARLSELERTFEAAVTSILGIAAEQQPQLLAAALQEQQQLQDVQVRQQS